MKVLLILILALSMCEALSQETIQEIYYRRYCAGVYQKTVHVQIGTSKLFRVPVGRYYVEYECSPEVEGSFMVTYSELDESDYDMEKYVLIFKYSTSDRTNSILDFPC